MKKYFLFWCIIVLSVTAHAQSEAYPEPEFSNEVYSYRRDSSNKLFRLEKNSSKMDTKTKMGGMAGAENSYPIDGARSTVRFSSGKSLSFVFSTAANQSAKPSPQMDSAMKANGMDPAKMITLYNVEVEKGERKILLMKSGGALPFASKKSKSSDKFSFSVRKIRNGYWELVVDKSLLRGEYAFTIMSMTSMDGAVTIFAFGID